MPALHNVQRHAIKVNAGAAGHEGMLVRKYIEPGPFNLIDRYLGGIATSIKSIDLDAKTYQTGSNLTSVLNKHINDLAKFAGADWAKVTVPGNAAKELQLAIPHGGSQAQQAAIQAAAQRAQAQGIKLTTTIIP